MTSQWTSMIRQKLDSVSDFFDQVLCSQRMCGISLSHQQIFVVAVVIVIIANIFCTAASI